MAPEVKSKGGKARRVSGQTLRLRKKRWLMTGLKADRKYVGELVISAISFVALKKHPVSSVRLRVKKRRSSVKNHG